MMMESTIKDYISREILGGKDVGLDESTPLLEWGIINSFELTRMVTFLREAFNVDVDPTLLTAGNFESVSAIGRMVARLKATP